MQRDAHQSSLAARLNVWHSEQWLRSQLSILVHTHTARSFSEEHASVGRPDDRPHNFQVWNYSFNPERRLSQLRRFDFASTATGRRMTTGDGNYRDREGY